MNKVLLYGALAATTVGAVVLTPLAAGAVSNGFGGNGQAPSQAIRARDGSGSGAQAGGAQDQVRQYIHQADGTCDGTGVGDGTGTQQRRHGRQ